MQHGTVSGAERMSQGVIAWPQVRRIPKVKNRAKKEKNFEKNRRLRRAMGPHLPPAWVSSRALAPHQRCVCPEKYTDDCVLHSPCHGFSGLPQHNAPPPPAPSRGRVAPSRPRMPPAPLALSAWRPRTFSTQGPYLSCSVRLVAPPCARSVPNLRSFTAIRPLPSF